MSAIRMKKFMESKVFQENFEEAMDTIKNLYANKAVAEKQILANEHYAKFFGKVVQGYTSDAQNFNVSLSNARKDEVSKKALLEEGLIPEDKKK